MHEKHPTNSLCPVAAHDERRAAYQASVCSTSKNAQQRSPTLDLWMPVWMKHVQPIAMELVKLISFCLCSGLSI